MALAAPAAAECALEPGETAIVRAVVDGDTVLLDRAVDGAMEVRLVGLQAPKLPLGRKGFRPWPLAAESKAALERLTLNRTVRLSYGGARMDRHGRRLAHLHDLEPGTWIQGAMLSAGMARVYSFSDNRSCVAEMLALEGQARNADAGIWSHPFYAVRDHGQAGDHLNTFQLVEGTVLDAARVRGRVYLNFGADWRQDFTITMESGARRLYRQAGLDPLDLKGRALRVRGWLRNFNGPLIETTHPEQIEFLDR